MPARIELLFQKFIDGSCTAQEYEELMNLLKANEHEEKVRQMLQQVYQGTARSLKSVTYVDQQGLLQVATEEERGARLPGKKSRVRTLVWSAAAALLLMVGGWWLNKKAATSPDKLPAHQELAMSKTTRRGEMKFLLLPDGTKVWLNVASTLEFPPSFIGKTREVKLTGEAYFDVMHAADKPFLIRTGHVVTRVLGTAFNIKAYPGQADVVVSVQRGKVQVSKDDQVMATLTKGQEVKVINAAEEATVSATSETNVAAWTNGRLIYESRTIGEIVSDLERTYNATIILQDSSISKEVYTTSFRRDIGVDDALAIICKAIDLTLSKENNTYLLSKKEKR